MFNLFGLCRKDDEISFDIVAGVDGA